MHSLPLGLRRMRRITSGVERVIQLPGDARRLGTRPPGLLRSEGAFATVRTSIRAHVRTGTGILRCCRWRNTAAPASEIVVEAVVLLDDEHQVLDAGGRRGRRSLWS